MSGPVTDRDEPPIAADAATLTGDRDHRRRRRRRSARSPCSGCCPRRGRRTVGPWCFADVMGPVSDAAAGGIGPHPHIGLQTVTWLLEGELLHLDSLGSEQPIRPGPAEPHDRWPRRRRTRRSHRARGALHGIQLWIAQPEATRHGTRRLRAPRRPPAAPSSPGLDVTVLVGSWPAPRSPARCDTRARRRRAAAARGPPTVPLDAVVRARHPGGRRRPVGRRPAGARRPPRLPPAWTSSARPQGAGAGRGPAARWRPVPGRGGHVVELRRPRPRRGARGHAAWTARDARFGAVRSALEPVDVGPPPWSTRLSRPANRALQYSRLSTTQRS